MNWLMELRYTLRILAKNRSYTAVAAITLALCIGANTAIFSMADAIVNRPFAFPELSRVVAISETIPKASAERRPVKAGDYFDFVEQNRAFERLAAYQRWDARLTGGRESEQVSAFQVSPGFFQLIGIAPLRGRVFADQTRDDERHAIVVSYGFWKQRLASDRAAVGRTLNVNGVAYTVVGVMPEEFDFPTYTEMWVPWMTTAEQAKAARAAETVNVIGRLKPGISLAQARAQMTLTATDLARKYPATNAGIGVDVMHLSDSADPYAVRYMTVISVAVAFLLVLACANVANLQLARCAMRRREIALRVALGAGRWRIARQLFIEGVLLAMAGAGLGLPLAFRALDVIRNSLPELVTRHLPGLRYAEVDATVLGWMLLAAVATGIVFSLPAAFQISVDHAHEVLKEGGRGLVSSGGRRMRSALVVCEIAFALVLLVGAALLFQSFHNLTTARQGFDPANVLTFSMRAPEFEYREDQQVVNHYQEALRRLRQLPEAGSVALISELPALADSRTTTVLIEGRPAPPPESPLLAELRATSEDYFRTLNIPLLDGRAFTAHDGAAGQPVAVISKAAARRFWPGQNAIGQHLELVSSGRRTGQITVIGISGDVNHFFLDAEIRPTVYVPFRQLPLRSMNVLVKTSAGAKTAASAIRDAMSGLDRSRPGYNLASLSRFFDDLSGGVRVIANLIAIFAALALALAAAGIYAVMHYSVAQRTQEIGIRMALGARPSDVWKLVLGNSLQLAGGAVGVGLPMAWILSRAMTAVLSGMVTLGPFALGAATLLVVGTALLASYLPARQATRVDPLAAMRYQ